MKPHYRLTIERNFPGYSLRLKASKSLARDIAEAGTNHTTFKDAQVAAVRISKSPLVVRVTIERVVVHTRGIYRNGARMMR